MPGADLYTGLSLADAVERLAEYHHAQETRHISQYEFELLMRAVDELRRSGPGLNGPSPGTG